MHRIWLIHQNGKLTHKMFTAYPQFNRSHAGCEGFCSKCFWLHPILSPYHFNAHWSSCPPTSTDQRLHPWPHKSNLPSMPSGRGDTVTCVLDVGSPSSFRGGELQSPTGVAGLVMHLFLVPFSSFPFSVSFTSQELVPKSLSWVSCVSRTPRDQDSVFSFRD